MTAGHRPKAAFGRKRSVPPGVNDISAAVIPRLFAYGFVAVMSIGSSALILRILGVERVGPYFATIATALVTFAISDQSLSSVALRDASMSHALPRDAQALLRSILGLRLASWTVAWAAVSVIICVRGNTPDPLLAVVALYLWVVLMIVTSALQIPAQSAMRQGRASGLLVLQAAASLATTAVLASLSAPDWAYFGVPVPGLSISALVLLRDAEARAVGRPSFHIERGLVLVRTNALLGAAGALNVISNRLAPVLTLEFGGREVAGQYGAGFRLADAVESMAPLIMTVLLPLLARSAESSKEALGRRLLGMIERMVPLGILTGGALGLWGSHILGLLGGPDFAGLDGVFHGLGLFVVFAFGLQPINYVLLAGRRYRDLFISSALAAVTLVVATPVLVSGHGAAGAAYATALSFFVLGACSAIAVRDLGGRGWPRLVAAATGCMVGSFLCMVSGSVLWGSAGCLLLSAGSYLLCKRATKRGVSQSCAESVSQL